MEGSADWETPVRRNTQGGYPHGPMKLAPAMGQDPYRHPSLFVSGSAGRVTSASGVDCRTVDRSLSIMIGFSLLSQPHSR